jgi:hypothetical protein
MTNIKKLRDTSQHALEEFMELLDDDDLRRLHEAVQRYESAPTWWLRDELTAEVRRRKSR